MNTKVFFIGEIFHENGRTIIYSNEPTKKSDAVIGRYYVIAGLQSSKMLKIGDMIEYEGIGTNFGRFIRRVQPSETSRIK